MHTRSEVWIPPLWWYCPYALRVSTRSGRPNTKEFPKSYLWDIRGCKVYHKDQKLSYHNDYFYNAITDNNHKADETITPSPEASIPLAALKPEPRIYFGGLASGDPSKPPNLVEMGAARGPDYPVQRSGMLQEDIAEVIHPKGQRDEMERQDGFNSIYDKNRPLSDATGRPSGTKDEEEPESEEHFYECQYCYSHFPNKFQALQHAHRHGKRRVRMESWD